MSTQHTSGPWRYMQGTKGVYAEGKAICTVHGRHKGQDLGREANACLIAAAPDLFKVLEMVQATLPHIGGNEMSVHSMLKDIAAVIAKATGAQP